MSISSNSLFSSSFLKFRLLPAFNPILITEWMAYLYSEGEDVEPNPVTAMRYAQKAADLKDPEGINFVASLLMRGKEGIAKNPTKAIELYKSAAALNDPVAMTKLAFIYLGGIKDVLPEDEKTSYFWAKKGAEAGGGQAMALLSNMFEEGKVVGKSVIKARFWANQAYLSGVGQRDNSAEKLREAEMSNMINSIDFRDQYSVYQSSDGQLYEVNEGPDLLGGLMSSVFEGAMARRLNPQQIINGVEYMYTKAGKKIYGGTLTSAITSDIQLKKGQQVKVSSFGTVNLGQFAGLGSPDGIYGFQGYSIIQSIPHAAIIGGINKNWILFGSSIIYTATEDGALQLAINDTDYSNNKGYFDCVIEVL